MTQVAVIMAGGHGERFWPMSRSSKPKQLLKIFSDHSMIRETYLRLKAFLPDEHIFIVAGRDFKDQILSELPELDNDNYIVEPFRRDTAAAIALSAIYVEKKIPGAVMLICASDHLISDVNLFKDIVTNGYKIAKATSCLLTLGIKPTRNETGYGYIEVGDKISEEKDTEAYEVKQFVEKPDYLKAAQYVEKGNFFWNSGMFIWRTETIINEIKQHMPDLYEGLIQIRDQINFMRESIQEYKDDDRKTHLVNIKEAYNYK